MVLYYVFPVLNDRTQYGLYQDAISLARSANAAKWNKAIFWVFDTPSNKGLFEVKIEKKNTV